MVKNLPAVQESWVQSLGLEGPLEKEMAKKKKKKNKEMATHFNILAWKIPWTEEPGGLQYMMSQKNQT